MAEERRYNAWFTDAREKPNRVPMEMNLVFGKNQFSGIGKDKIGFFAVISGKINGSDISFVKKYAKHGVVYKGKLTSTKTPMRANGTWHFPGHPNIKGNWGLVLQGSPTHGAVKHVKKPLPKPQQNTSSGEGWLHSIVQWIPFPFVATTYDAGASLFYLCTGNTKAAKERIEDAGIDLAWDVAAFVTADTAMMAREVERGAEVAARQVERSVVEASTRAVERRGTMEFHPALDTLAERATVTEGEFVNEAVHGAPPGDGVHNHAGSYAEIRGNHSLTGVTEANHIPASSSTRGTVYDIGHGQLSALSTEHALHQNMNRLIGTTGASEFSRDIRQAMTRYMGRKDLPSALKLQIMADYACWGQLERYNTGLQDLLRHLGTLRRTDGRPFLNRQELSGMLHWLQQEVQHLRGGNASQYLDHAEQMVIDLMSNI